METKTTTQGIVVLSEKKKWMNPTLIVIDQGDVNSGTVSKSVESAKTVPNGTKTYHS